MDTSRTRLRSRTRTRRYGPLVAATDGSYLADAARPTGAWAYTFQGHTVSGAVHRDDEAALTSTRMELRAVLELLVATRTIAAPLQVLVDCNPVCDVVNRIGDYRAAAWQKRSGGRLADVDLLEAIADELDGRDVVCRWVRGHADCRENLIVDVAARRTARAGAKVRLRPVAAA